MQLTEEGIEISRSHRSGIGGYLHTGRTLFRLDFAVVLFVDFFLGHFGGVDLAAGMLVAIVSLVQAVDRRIFVGFDVVGDGHRALRLQGGVFVWDIWLFVRLCHCLRFVLVRHGRFFGLRGFARLRRMGRVVVLVSFVENHVFLVAHEGGRLGAQGLFMLYRKRAHGPLFGLR